MAEWASQIGPFYPLVQHMRGEDVEVEADLCMVSEERARQVGATGDMPELTRRKSSEDLELPNSSQGCCWGWGGSPQQWSCVKQMAFWWVYSGGNSFSRW